MQLRYSLLVVSVAFFGLTYCLPCPNDEVLQYHYDSSLYSASNVSKELHYRALAYLQCQSVDSDGTTQFILYFDSVETSITETTRFAMIILFY